MQADIYIYIYISKIKDVPESSQCGAPVDEVTFSW